MCLDLFNLAYQADPLPGKILKAICEGGRWREIAVAECVEKEGQEMYQGKGNVPEGDELQLQLIQEHHDTALAGHPGR
jgi:hypothetical protein